jgi:hypothetical protein
MNAEKTRLLPGFFVGKSPGALTTEASSDEVRGDHPQRFDASFDTEADEQRPFKSVIRVSHELLRTASLNQFKLRMIRDDIIAENPTFAHTDRSIQVDLLKLPSSLCAADVN